MFQMPESWLAFMNTLTESAIDPDYNRRPLWRGHADPNWRLWSVAERNFFTDSLDAQASPDRSIFNQFMLERLLVFRDSLIGSPFTESLGIDINKIEDNALWAFGRHYGLESPLLDWSHSPYVASFFAFSDYVSLKLKHKYIAIYRMYNDFVEDGLRYRNNFSNKVAKKTDYIISQEILLRNIRLGYHHRQKAQYGVFTELKSEDHFDVVDFINSKCQSPLLVCYLIPASEAPKALASLMDMNIHYASLFPDPQGAALHANIRHNILWQHHSNIEMPKLRALIRTKEEKGASARPPLRHKRL
jgi:hypothetical protein